jgi:hypothetical protein
MAKTRRTERVQRSAEVRAKWAAHVSAWQAGGGRQSEYCRERGLDAKYFSIWKGRLLRAGAAHSNLAPSQTVPPLPGLVPVMVKPARIDELVGRSGPTRDAVFGLGVTSPNGIALNFRLPSVRGLPPLLAELARLLC